MFRRLVALATVSVFALIAVVPTTANADPPSGGDLDLSFVGSGRLQLSYNEGYDDAIKDMVVQPDGKTVLVGRAGTHENGDAAVVRLNPNGTLDPTFGGGSGKVAVNYGFFEDRANAVALQSDGKIVVAGYDFGQNFFVFRLNPNGSRDTSFGSNGVLETDFAGGGDRATGVGIQSDGKIVATGFATNSSGTAVFAAARYLSNGQLDRSYGNGGKALLPVAAFVLPTRDNSSAIMQGDKMVLVGGTPAAGNSSNSIALRINTNGSLDPSFGSGGVSLIGFGSQSVFNGVTTWGGAIFATGGVISGRYFNTTIAKMNGNGALDPTFGSGGLVISNLSRDNDSGEDILVQPSGRVVVGGNFYDGNGDDMVASRYLPDGRLDITFGQIGLSRATVSRYYDQAYAIAQQNDGKILLGGRVFNGRDDDIAVARMWGGAGLQGGRARPVAFDRPGRKIKASRLRAITGTANANYLDSVELAIRKPNKALLRKKRVCVWMKLNGQAVRVRATKVGAGKFACTDPVWNTVVGATSWNARVGRFKPGNYVLIGRGMTRYGQLGATSSRPLRITRG